MLFLLPARARPEFNECRNKTKKLNSNQLVELPDAIGQLTGLKALLLHNNQLTALPESIVALTNLGHLSLLDNPPLIRSAQSAAVSGVAPTTRSSRYYYYYFDYCRRSLNRSVSNRLEL